MFSLFLHNKKFTFFVVFILGLIYQLFSCTQDNQGSPNGSNILLPIYKTGDTIFNHKGTINEETRIIFDSLTGQGLTLTSTHGEIPNQSSTYFIQLQIKEGQNVHLLDTIKTSNSILRGPILPAIAKGSIIDKNIQDEGRYIWRTQAPGFPEYSGYLKYHIYTAAQGSILENVKPGENNIVFKFGDIGDERMGWLNVVYQDTLCFIKEGFYSKDAGQEIIVGEK